MKSALFLPPCSSALEAAKGKPEIGGDRQKLGLLPEAVELIRKVRAVNPRCVVIVQTAGAVMVTDWYDEVPALVLGWYAGMEGGYALADLLLGRKNFAGRLPYAMAASEMIFPTSMRPQRKLPMTAGTVSASWPMMEKRHCSRWGSAFPIQNLPSTASMWRRKHRTV